MWKMPVGLNVWVLECEFLLDLKTTNVQKHDIRYKEISPLAFFLCLQYYVLDKLNSERK